MSCVALADRLAEAATITWTNTSGGFWSDATNWSPNQVPGNTDNALITTPGTYTVTLDLAPNFQNTVTNAANLTLGAGGGAAGVQTFLVTNLSYSEFLVGSLLEVTNGGVLTMTNDFSGLLIANPLLIGTGGVFNGQGENLPGPLVIANGGVMNSLNGKLTSNSLEGGQTTTLTVAGGGVLNSTGGTLAGPTTVANGGRLNVMNVGVSVALTVSPGGVLNVLDYPSESLGLNGPLTNSGTINVTNGGIGLLNTIYAGAGGLINQTGGSINLQGSTAIGGGGYAYLINQGMITESTGTNSIDCQVFDNSQGTVTNLSGMLSLGLFQTNLTGIFFSAAGATIKFSGANIANDNSAAQLTLGTPLVLDGSGQYQLMSGYLYLPANVPTNLELLGDTVELGPNFQGGAITNLSLVGMQLLNALPITGTLTTTNSGIATNVVVAGGGVFAYEGTGFLAGTVTVDSGGIFNVINPGGNMYDDIRLNQGAIVAHGGIMNCEGYFTITTLTNAGTLNLASQLVLYTMTNGIVNQPGGLINLESNAVITIAATNDYFINQGSIVQNAGVGATNSISYQANQPFQFDNSQGTITNLSGTLVLPSFQGTLAGTFFAAAGATIQLGGGTIGTPLVPGTPLVLGGSGQYQFISGYLYLAANTIPNLSLQGGQLTLGAGFQGGAITNLTLDGITFSNQSPTTLPINGTFTIINSGNSGSINSSLWAGFYGNGVSGNYMVAGGDVLNLTNATLNGAVTVTGGGVLNGSGTIYGAVTVANGGVFNSSSTLYGNLTVANGGLFNGSAFMIGGGAVMVASGGVLNLGNLFLFGPLTNSGTINITNAYSSISMYNNGMPGAQGGVINQAGGLIDFLSDSTGIGGSSGGYEYFINQGRIVKSAGSGLSGIGPAFATNSGTITAQTGQILMAGQWTLLSSGSLNVVLNSATNYGSFIISTNYPTIVGNADLAGAFNATLNNGYVPTNGTTFNVITYGSFTGSFSSLGLPAADSWQSNYGSTNFTLLVGSPKPQFGTFNLSGTNLIFNGLGGSPGSNYVVLASTNLALPLANWSALTTNTFDGSGQFHYTNHVSPAKPRQFFIFKLP
jgi:hypothetical protein